MESSTQLTILHFNDVYNIEEKKTEPVGGVARFKTALDSFRELDPLIIFSGDLFEPSMLSTAYDGEQMIKPVNDFLIDVACFGNHDFDLDYDVLTEYVEKTKFPWVLSNVKTRSNFKPLAGGKETYIIEKKGLRIGFIGLAESEWVYECSSLDLDEIIYEDFVKCAKRLNKFLREIQGCDIVIALTHMRNPNDLKLAKEFGELDLILGGHDHINIIEKSNETYVIKSGSDFAEFNKINLTLIPEKSIETLPEGVKDELYKGKYLMDIKTIEVTKVYEPNPELQKHVEEHLAQFEEKMKHPVLFSTVPFETRFELVRSSEQNFPNFLADILRLDSGCDCALINSGVFRSNKLFPEGVFTMGDIRFILPFEDLIMKVRLTGKQLWLALENSVSTYPTLDGRFLAVSGLSFSFDPTKQPGSRIPFESIQIKDGPLELETQYNIATILFIYHGKNGFGIVKEGQRLNEENVAEEIHTILKKFFALTKDPKIIEEAKKMGAHPNDILHNFEFLKPPTLQRKMSEMKRLEFYHKLQSIINDIIEVDGHHLISVSPKIEQRITIIQETTQ